MLMTLIMVLDLTVDAAANEEDKFKNLNQTIDKQKKIVDQCFETRR